MVLLKIFLFENLIFQINKLKSLKVTQVKDEKDGDEDDSCDVVFDVVCDVVCKVVCDVV